MELRLLRKGVSISDVRDIEILSLKHVCLLIKDGTLKVLGDVSISYGADIEVFSGGELTFKGGLVSNLNTVIVCANKIEIGKDVGFGRNITIRDNNGGHYINITGYKDSAPVIIGDKVWLCESCTIMPGAKNWRRCNNWGAFCGLW